MKTKLRTFFIAVLMWMIPANIGAQDCDPWASLSLYGAIVSQSCTTAVVTGPNSPSAYVLVNFPALTTVSVSIDGPTTSVTCFNGSYNVTYSTPATVSCVSVVFANLNGSTATITRDSGSVGAAGEATPAPTPTVAAGGGISAQEISLPFDFEVIQFDRTGPALPEIDFVDTALINQIGSIALTLFSFFNLEILGIMVVLILAVIALAWLFSFVTDAPTAGASIRHYDIISGNEAVDIAYGAANAKLNTNAAYMRSMTEVEAAELFEPGDDIAANEYRRLTNNRRMADIDNARAGLRAARNYYRQGAAAYKRLRR